MVLYKSVLFLSILLFGCTENTQEEQNTLAEIQPTLSVDQVVKKVDVTRIEVTQPNGPKMIFDHKRHDYGEIWHADKVVHEFEFTNAGGEDLIIKNVKVSCGCTTPEYPDEAIKPGAKAIIKITFNSVGKWGRQKATAQVVTNESLSETHTLVLAGLVKVKPKKED